MQKWTTPTPPTCTNATSLVAWPALLARGQTYVQFVLQPFYTGVHEETVETRGWFVIIPVFYTVTAVGNSKS